MICSRYKLKQQEWAILEANNSFKYTTGVVAVLWGPAEEIEQLQADGDT